MRTRHTARSGIEGTFAAVLRAYESSPFFPKNEGTAANYRRAIRWAEAVLGRYSTLDPDNGIRPKLVQEALDLLADTPGQQENFRAVLVTIDKWAAPRELLLRSITFGVRVVGSDGGHLPWTDPQVELAQQHARADLARVVTIAVNTGQRGSDIVRMRLSDISEETHPITGRVHPGINVVQKKTGLRLWVPFTEELIAAVDGWRQEARHAAVPQLLFVTDPIGRPYIRNRLSVAWVTERQRNPLLEPHESAGLVLHGLRGTCVVRLRKSGASERMICAMVGMSPAMVTRYSRFADQVDMALAAVHQLNVRTPREREDTAKSPNLLKMQDRKT